MKGFSSMYYEIFINLIVNYYKHFGTEYNIHFTILHMYIKERIV